MKHTPVPAIRSCPSLSFNAQPTTASFKTTLSQKSAQILRFQCGYKLLELHFLQLAVIQTRKQNTRPKDTFPPWNFLTEAYELTRILKAQVGLSFHKVTESRDPIFPSLSSRLIFSVHSILPTAQFYDIPKIQKQELFIISDLACFDQIKRKMFTVF